MTRLNFVILFLSIIFILIDCKKDNTTSIDVSKVKSIISSSSDTTLFTYDSTRRLISLIRKDSSGTFYESFNYLNSKTVIMRDSDNHEPVKIETFTLNSDGYAIKAVISGRFNATFLFSYDSNNFPVNKSETLTVKDGNVVKRVNGNEIIVREFYTDKIMINSGISFLGKIDKNILKQETTSVNNELIVKITYVYDFDSNNRVSKEISTQTDNSGNNSITYRLYTYY